MASQELRVVEHVPQCAPSRPGLAVRAPGRRSKGLGRLRNISCHVPKHTDTRVVDCKTPVDAPTGQPARSA